MAGPHLAGPLLFCAIGFSEELVMRFQQLSIGLGVAALTLSLSSAWAQERGRPQSEPASRPSNGDTVGSAAPRGGGDSGSSSSASSTSSSSTSSAPANNGSSTNSAPP